MKIEDVTRNLSDFTNDELFVIMAKIKEEIDNRTGEEVVWSHKCSGSSKHHIGKYKHYAKAVTAIDLSVDKPSGYAVIGEFLPSPVAYDENEIKISGNTLVLEVCSSTKTEVYRAADPYETLYKYSGRITFEDLEEINKLL